MSAKNTKKKTEFEEEEKAKTTSKTARSTPLVGKKRLMVSYKNLSPELLELVKEKYPKGYFDDVFKVDKGNGDFFHAITLDTDDATYLIKVDVKIDTEIEEVERQLFGSGGDSDSGDVGDEFPSDEGGDFEAEASDDDE